MKNELSNELLTVDRLYKSFNIGSGILSKKKLRAVEGVSFKIKVGETLGLVGESGSGKTTVGRTVIGLYTPSEGRISFDGIDTSSKDGRAHAGRNMSMVFQDPYSSLDPRMTALDIIAEPLDIHGMAVGRERRERVLSLMEKVGLNPEHARRYPHEFSGGQRQRIGIARALSITPKLVICDEPVSALDVSVRAQIVNLFSSFKEELQLSYLFIAHDIPIVRHISDRIAVMYLGRIVEMAKSDDLCDDPLHPYTKALIASVLPPDPKEARAMRTYRPFGDISGPIDEIYGCPFRTRCPHAQDICKEATPALNEVAVGHYAACHRVKEIN